MDAMKELVAQRLAIIKQHMPHVLACIEDRAQHIGNEAYALVRRGLRGEPGCFYAMEAGHVVGAPFGRDHPGMQEAARFLVLYGCAHVCIWHESAWPEKRAEGGDGAA